jgi:hypothetical protein
MSCDVFLVGFNPATNGTAQFWSYWLSGYGFDKKRWLVEYKACRKPPKKSVSPTRHAGVGGDLREPRFLLGCEMDFHAFRILEKRPALAKKRGCEYLRRG